MSDLAIGRIIPARWRAKQAIRESKFVDSDSTPTWKKAD
jgi:hypothetical protein